MKIEGLENLLAAQQNFAKAIVANPAITQLAEIAKAASKQQKLFKAQFPLTDLAKQLKIGIDTTGIDAMVKQYRSPFESNEFARTMRMLHENNQKMFAGWRAIAEKNPFGDILKRLQEQQKAIFGTIHQSTFNNIAELVQERLNNQAAEAVAIVKEVQTHEQVTTKDIDRLKIFVGDSIRSLNQTIENTQKSPMAILAFVMTLISFLYIFYAELKPAPAIQQQVSEIREILEKHVADTIKEYGMERRVRIKCSLRLRPKRKSLFIHKLNADDVVKVIAVNHQWAYVTVLDNNNIPVIGWVQKKYLQ